MPDYTPNLNLYLPGGGGSGTIPDEIADIDKLNENFRTIDASLGGTIVPAVAGYTNRFNGNLVYARNEKKLFIESSADGGLLNVSPGSNFYRGTSAERASFATGGYAAEWDHWCDTTLNLVYIFRGGDWTRSGVENFTTGNFSVASGVTVQRQRLSVNHDDGHATLYLALTGVTGTDKFLGYVTRTDYRPLYLDSYPVGLSTSAGVATTSVGSIRIRQSSDPSLAGEMWYYGPAAPTAVFVNARYLFK